MKWTVSEKYNDNFTVLKDDQPLAYVLSNAKLLLLGIDDNTASASFDFDIIY